MKIPFSKGYLAGYIAGTIAVSIVAPFLVWTIDGGMRGVLGFWGVQYGSNPIVGLPWYAYFVMSAIIAAAMLGLRILEGNSKPKKRLTRA